MVVMALTTYRADSLCPGNATCAHWALGQHHLIPILATLEIHGEFEKSCATEGAKITCWRGTGR